MSIPKKLKENTTLANPNIKNLEKRFLNVENYVAAIGRNVMKKMFRKASRAQKNKVLMLFTPTNLKENVLILLKDSRLLICTPLNFEDILTNVGV